MATTKIGIDEYVQGVIATYGTTTLKHRAIPSLADGLKPVQRRILWAMHGLGLNPKAKRLKAARTVGEVLGKLHPHGDAAIYTAMVNMADQPESPIDGAGNWGTLTNSAAAQRYTEARLSAWGFDNYFDGDYTPIIDMVKNYDDSRHEPLQLPSKTLSLLINGSFGIAMGATCRIPSFTKESIAKILHAYFAGKKVDPQWVADTLEPQMTYAGYTPKDSHNTKGMLDLVCTGKGAIVHYPQWSMEGKTSIVLSGFPTHLRDSNAVAKVLEKADVRNVVNETTLENGIRYVVSLRRGTNVVNRNGSINEKKVADIIAPFCWRVTYNLSYLTETMVDGEEGRAAVQFHSGSMMEMFERWVKWRRKLERRSLQYRIDRLNARIEKLNLFLLAHTNRNVLDACRDKDDPKTYLVKELDITNDQADILLGLTVRQLTRLHHRDLKAEVKTHKSTARQHKTSMKNIDGILAKQFAA